AAARGRQQWGFDDSKPVLLITGGSQGAASINAAVKAALPELVEHVQVLHAYGPRNEAPQAQDGYVPVPYIEDMAAALAVADLTVCRSGAMTVAEITAAGLPAIYVPLPHGNGEQALNSQHVVEAGGAIMIKDSDLTGQRLVEEVVAIADNPQRREEMVAAAQDSGAGDVSKMLADRIAADVRKEQEKESN
ncbi:glycosyltransferase, partial [Corynebacterium stationis]